MNDEQLLRYSRHILLDEIGIEGQTQLIAARALIVGAGGLGSQAALYLASAGIGEIILADGDTVDLTNLQRQIMHREARIGANKAVSGQQAIHELNRETRVTALSERLTSAQLAELVGRVDVVLDCCDNFATRYAINRACVAHRTPLVSGAAIRFSGQLAVFDYRQDDAPCYHCLFPEGDDVEETRCAVMGVFAPLTGIVGSLQAAEAIKLLCGTGTPSTGRLQLYDALRLEWRQVNFGRDPHCLVCGPTAKAHAARVALAENEAPATGCPLGR